MFLDVPALYSSVHQHQEWIEATEYSAASFQRLRVSENEWQLKAYENGNILCPEDFLVNLM